MSDEVNYFFKKFRLMVANSAYDKHSSRFLFIEQVIQKIVPSERLKGSYLDIGCSESGASIVLSKNFLETVNIDIEKWIIKRGKKNCRNNCVNAHFAVCDAQKLPLKDSTFDIITSFSVIEHLSNQNDFLHEVNRLLRNNGIFIMQVPNRNFFVELHTGFPFPSFFSKKIWSYYCRYLLKIGEYQVKNLTYKEAAVLCNSNFNHTFILKCNYTEDTVPSNFRTLYKLLSKFGILNVFPMGWIVFCTKN
jgi:ubiquinone/menaquinone biosynthesis C-methylase UbiE